MDVHERPRSHSRRASLHERFQLQPLAPVNMTDYFSKRTGAEESSGGGRASYLAHKSAPQTPSLFEAHDLPRTKSQVGMADWTVRAGAKIADVSRDDRGTGWMLTRASSTSLYEPEPTYPYPSADLDLDMEEEEEEVDGEEALTKWIGWIMHWDMDEDFNPRKVREQKKATQTQRIQWRDETSSGEWDVVAWITQLAAQFFMSNS